MGRYISIWFNERELERLERIRERESKRRGKEISKYELIKEWIMKMLDAKEGRRRIEPNLRDL